jgi:hypothetical protein
MTILLKKERNLLKKSSKLFLHRLQIVKVKENGKSKNN